MATTTMTQCNDAVLFDTCWKQLKGLSDQMKLQLAIRLTADVSEHANSEPNEYESENAYTQRFIDKFAGAWNGNESVDEIMTVIKSGFHSTEQPKVI